MSFIKSLRTNKTLLVHLLFITIVLIIGQYWQIEFFFNRIEIDQGKWWKTITGNFTHSNIPHLLLNLSGLWLLVFLFIDTLNYKTFFLSYLLLSVIVGSGLYTLNLELNGYYGFSGTLYGLYFVASTSAILKKDYFTGISVAILIGGKVLWDFFTGGNQSSAELIGIPIANDAHLYGFLGAIFISVLLILNKYLSKN